MEKNDFKRRANQDSRMNDNHPFEVRFANANSTLTQHALLMAAGNSQFNKAEHSYGSKEYEV